MTTVAFRDWLFEKTAKKLNKIVNQHQKLSDEIKQEEAKPCVCLVGGRFICSRCGSLNSMRSDLRLLEAQ